MTLITACATTLALDEHTVTSGNRPGRSAATPAFRGDLERSES
jgi:hypothetical protein